MDGTGTTEPTTTGTTEPTTTGTTEPTPPGGPAPAPAVTGTAASSAPQPTTAPGPTLLPANPVFRFYKGGEGIDRFRGVAAGSGPGAPEDWVGSTTTSFGNDSEGLAKLEDGRRIRDAIAADPVAFLGAGHVAALGANPGLLVKLLDAGERLAVHFHPGRAVAREHLHSDFGKTEAWLILEARPGAHVHLGLREPIDAPTLRRWVDEQDSEEMLRALKRVEVRAGDALYVPAGTLHTIGEGITLIELQEPSDMSVVIEWRGAGVTPAEASLELGWETILPAAELDARMPIHVPADTVPAGRGSSCRRMLPPEADAYFRAQLLTLEASAALELEPQFSILIGTGGELTVAAAGHPTLRLVRGQAALIPHGAGTTTIGGSGTAIRCLPPRAPAQTGGARR